MASRTLAPDPAVANGLLFLEELLADYHPRDFAVRLWEGTVWPPQAGHPARFILALAHPGALRNMFSPGSELGLAEAYLFGDFDVEGDICAAFGLADYLIAKHWGLRAEWRLHKLLSALAPRAHPTGDTRALRLHGRPHSKSRDRQAVTSHYDLSNDFYALWLDRNLVYSCAYFQSPQDDLDTAQEHKLDYICRKLRLRPGERLLDLGCGWGGLLLHAGKHYGVEALGITLSRPQAELANQRLAAAGLASRCRVEVRDYRDLEPPASYDKIASIGMFEHVGEERLPDYFAGAWQALRPGGVFLNHGIARSPTAPPKPQPTFLQKYVFPDGEMVPISVTLRAAGSAGFEVRDVENLREHYERTLRCWVQRLESRAAEARRIVGEASYRIWRLYMAGSAHAFATGRQAVYQVLLSKPDRGHSGLPLSRADWYR